MTRYKQRTDGEGFVVPCCEVYRIACCDCGLVHDMVFVSEDGKPIGVAARRNARATGQKRRATKPLAHIQELRYTSANVSAKTHNSRPSMSEAQLPKRIR